MSVFLVALVIQPAGDAATLANRWSFDSDSSDSAGGNDGVLIGGATVSGGRLNLSGGTGPTAASMGFSSTVDIGSTQGGDGITFETWYTDTGSGNWSKLFAFGNGTAGSNIIFNIQQGGSGEGRIQYQGMPEANFGPRPALNTEHHLALTISATGEVNAWIDGSQINASPPNASGDGNDLTTLPSSWERIGASAWGDAGMLGTVNEFRIWAGEFSAAEVAESLAAGPDDLAGVGLSVTAFTASPAFRKEGEVSTLAWAIDNADVVGSLMLEIRDPGGALIHSSSSASGNLNVTIGDTGGSPQLLKYTINAWDSNAPGNVKTKTVDIDADPGIPSADAKTVQTVTTTPVAVTLSGTDPNAHPNPALLFAVVGPPSSGSLTGSVPNLTYTANPGFTGSDSFTYKSNDGKYDSPLATVAINVVPAPAPPTDIALSTTNISEGVISGGLVATLLSSDPNPGDAHTYSLVAGVGDTDNARFSIIGNQLRAATNFAGQVGNTYTIRLRTLDSGGLSYQESVTLTVVMASDAVVITEIHFNPPENPVRQEFIELHNPSDSPADLGGWRLTSAVSYVFPGGTTIPAGGYLVIAEDPATLLATLGATALGPFAGNLSSDGETVRLRDANDNVIDEVDYKVGFPWPVASDGSGASIELIHPSLDNSLGSSWRPSIPQSLLGPATLLPYSDNGWSWRPGNTEASNPVGAWRGQGFVEAGSWNPNVQTPIGYGTVNGIPLNTTVTGMQGSYSCLFLRNTFTIAPGEIPTQILLNFTADDGIVVWINGVEVERRRFNTGEAPTIDALANANGNEGTFESKSIINPGAFLVEGTNTIAVQVFNVTLSSSDLGFDIEVVRPGQDDAQPQPTPGLVNTAAASNAAPNIRKVNHLPEQPSSADPVVITAKVTDPEGVAAVSLEYQIVAPGAYVPAVLPLNINTYNGNPTLPRPDNPDYETGWVSVAMLDDGSGGDALGGDDIFTVTLPARAHRSLVRYRITVEDGLGLAARVPYPDDASLNFAYFVYDGVPDYEGHSAATLASVPVYHVITRGADYAECLAYSGNQIQQGTLGRFLYNWNATIVYDGEVYDNIRYRLRGANGRYHQSGKRSMRFRLNDGYYFQARDQQGKKYPNKRRTLTTGKGFDNKSTLTYGLNEAVNMYLFQKAGVPAIDTHWVHWRVIDGAAEAPDRWRGDFHGLNFILETYDVRFMEAHDLEKGNLYKLINQTTDWDQQQRYQAAFAPSDGSDHNTIEQQLDGGDTAAYISAHVNMDKWNRWHSMVEAIRHYDYWPSANKNMVYYFEPDYLPANNNKGKLWILPWDTDASWGPNWNSGHDVAYNALFAAGGGGSDGNTTPELWPEYFNTMREIRDLLWQPDQINPLIDEFAAAIQPLEAADASRWKGAPADAGNYNGLGGAGASSLGNLAQDMKNFAFTGWSGGSGPTVGAGGRAAFLDSLQASNGEGGQIPATPTITYTGSASFPTNGLSFGSSAFTDPQGNGSFAKMEWRIAQMTDPTAPNHDPTARFKLEIESDWESGELAAFNNAIEIPTVAVRSGLTYRARVRHQDTSGRWSHWSAPVQFTTTLPDISDYLAGLVVTEIMYHPSDPSAAEILAGYNDDDFFEYIELKNVGATTLDLKDLRFTKGVDFDFLAASITSLAPGEIVLVVKDLAAFELRYGAGLPVAGAWQSSDKLDNGGEQVKLSFGAGDTVRDFTYDDIAPWPTSPDGSGPSLNLQNPGSVPDHALAASWIASGASPGIDDPGVSYASWREGIFGPGNPPGSGELDDPDFDGVANLIEYATGADPLNSSSFPTATVGVVVVGADEFPTITYTRRTDLPDITDKVGTSTDLASWDSGPAFNTQVGAPIDHGNGTETVTIRSLKTFADEPRQFFRVVVETL